jgi:hypothetical protein
VLVYPCHAFVNLCGDIFADYSCFMLHFTSKRSLPMVIEREIKITQ